MRYSSVSKVRIEALVAVIVSDSVLEAPAVTLLSFASPGETEFWRYMRQSGRDGRS